MSQPPKKKPPKIIYETVFHGQRLVVATERDNWIVIRGSDQLENFMRDGERWFFSNLSEMLKALHQYFIRKRIKRLDFEGMARIVEKSNKDVGKLGHRLVAEIADNDLHGALPRFPCDHVVTPHHKKEKQR